MIQTCFTALVVILAPFAFIQEVKASERILAYRKVHCDDDGGND
jgi:hypothetical protein